MSQNSVAEQNLESKLVSKLSRMMEEEEEEVFDEDLMNHSGKNRDKLGLSH